jgi:hypothetical protein
MKNAFTAVAASYFFFVFLRNGTLTKMIDDASRGAKDITNGLKPVSRLA